MKKILSLIFALSLLFAMTACESDDFPIPGFDRLYEKSISTDPHETGAYITLNSIEKGEYKIELDRNIAGEGTIYYKVLLSDGSINLYYDINFFTSRDLLSSVTSKVGIKSSGGYIEGSKVTVIIEALEKTSGYIEIYFKRPMQSDCSEGHSWDGGVITGEQDGAKEKTFTCALCSEKHTAFTENEGDGHIYSIAVDGNLSRLLYLPNKSAEAGRLVEIIADVICDSDTVIKVNGKEIERTHYDSDYWGYAFIMPNENITVTVE